MIHRLRRLAVALAPPALVTVATLSTLTVVAPHATAAPSAPSAAATAATGRAAVSSHPTFEHWATLSRTAKGYYYDAGQQNTHLVITRVPGALRFADTSTGVLRHKPAACDRKWARLGLVVVCPVPATVSPSHPMTVRVFTRLGNDYVNTTTLSAAFRLYGLADWGNDTFLAGAGNDFVNGARGDDRVSGGAGNDWLRTTNGDDIIWGGPGNDRLVGTTGRDIIRGGEGNDRVGGGDGNDLLYADAGRDFVLCGRGGDQAHIDRADRIMADCETVDRK